MKDQLKKEIGIRMRKIRKTLGFTQNKMISYFEIGRANYSRIEKGEIFPGPMILNTLRTNFDISLDWLMTNNGEMFIPKTAKKNLAELIDLSRHPEEMKALWLHMDKVPMVKYAVLSFYVDYIAKNKEYIDSI